MAGINPQTGLFDYNYQPSNAYQGSDVSQAATSSYGAPADMSAWQNQQPINNNQMANYTPTNTPSVSAPQINAGNGWWDSVTGFFGGDKQKTGGDTGGGMFDNFGGKDGWGMPAIQGASGLAQAWLGFEQLGQAEDQLKFQKGVYADQKSDYEEAMALRAKARAGAY